MQTGSDIMKKYNLVIPFLSIYQQQPKIKPKTENPLNKRLFAPRATAVLFTITKTVHNLTADQ